MSQKFYPKREQPKEQKLERIREWEWKWVWEMGLWVSIET